MFPFLVLAVIIAVLRYAMLNRMFRE